VRAQAAELQGFTPHVLVGSSFGGAVAVAMLDRGIWRGPTVLLAPAYRYFFGVARLPPGVPVIIAHGRSDDVISLADSHDLAATGSPEFVELVELDDGHRLDSLVESEALADLVRRAATLGR
jgi:pimeloyl-ACP methyl ester carboxylesterase